MEIKASVQLDWMEGRRIGFVFEASDEFEKICKGTHERYIMDIDWFRKKVLDKLRLKKGE
jgi:predicted thioesterase